MKQNIKLSYQSYGSSILLFIEAANNEIAYGKYLSLWNWNATSTGEGVRIQSLADIDTDDKTRNATCSTWAFEDAPFIKEGVLAVWSTVERMKAYFFNTRADAFVKVGELDYQFQAEKQAQEDFEAMAHESFRSINSNTEVYEFGTIAAEKPDDSGVEQWVAHGLAAK